MSKHARRLLFDAFWWLYSLFPLTGFLLIVNYLTDGRLDLISLFKIPLVGMVGVIGVFSLLYPPKLSGIACLFLLWGLLAVVVGVWQGTLISPPSPTHLYMTVVPILAISFGRYFALHSGRAGDRMIRRTMLIMFVLSVVSITLYGYLYYVAGAIAYYGLDSSLPLVGAWLLAQRQLLVFALALVLVLVSGKRAPLFAMAAPLALQLGAAWLAPRKARIGQTLVVLLIGAAAVYGAAQYGMLSRFEGLVALDLDDMDAVYVATSGRSHEIGGMIAFMNEQPWRWWTGAGIGARYTVLPSRFDNGLPPAVRHYVHLSLLTYVLVYGVPFVMAFIAGLLRLLWQLRARLHTFPVMCSVVLFVGSFFGAGLIVEPMFWFFLGMSMTEARQAAPSTARTPKVTPAAASTVPALGAQA